MSALTERFQTLMGHLKRPLFPGKRPERDDLADIIAILSRLQTLDAASIETTIDATKNTASAETSKWVRWSVLAFLPATLAAMLFLALGYRSPFPESPVSEGEKPPGLQSRSGTARPEESCPGGGGYERAGPLSELRQEAAQARALLLSGNVREARKLLAQAMTADEIWAAFAMAQSYDPNYLKDIPNPNAGPNRDRAKSWYRYWYRYAAACGLSMKQEQLDRVIAAMWYRSRKS